MDSDPSPSSNEGQVLETLTILVEHYEKKQGWGIPASDDPVEIIKIR